MSKKNYQKAADIVIHSLPDKKEAVANAFVLLFLDDNPRFDKDRFMKVCGFGVQ